MSGLILNVSESDMILGLIGALVGDFVAGLGGGLWLPYSTTNRAA